MTGMVDAWEIGVSLVLNDGIAGQTANINAQFESVQKAVDGINASLKVMPGLIADVKSAAAGLSSSFTAAANAAERIQAAMSQGGGAGGAPAAVPVAPPGGAQPMAAASDTVTGPAGPIFTPNLPAVIPGSRASGPEGWGYRGDNGYSGHLPPPDAPSGPGTALVPLGNNRWTYGAMPFPEVPPGSLDPQPPANPDGAQPQSDGTHDFWTNLFLFGTGAKVVQSAVSGAAQVSATQARLAINQASPQDIAKLTGEAQAAQAGSPLNIQDVLGIGQDYYSVTGKIPDQQTLTGLMDEAIVLQGEGVQNPVDELYAGIKSGEIAGKLSSKNADGSINTAPLMGYLDTATQAAIISQGRVDFNTALQIMTNAGPEGSRLSAHALGYSLLLAQQQGGSKTGAGIQAEGSEFLGGKMNQGVATILEGLKGPDGKPLLDKSKVQRMGLAGSWADSGALVDQQEAIADPYQWTVDHLIPALAGSSDPNAVLATIMRTQTRATGQRLMGDAINSGVQLERQYQRLQDTDSPPQAAATLENQSLQTNLQTAGAGLSALSTALAAASTPALITGLKAFDGAVAAASNFVNNNPQIGQEVDVGVAGGMAYLGYQVLKGLKGIIDKFGPQAESDAKSVEANAPKAAETVASRGLLGTALEAVIAANIADYLANAGTYGHPLPSWWPKSKGGPEGISSDYPSENYGGGPSGTATDPFHVVVKNQPVPGPTMPTGPTSPPAAASMPNPGKNSPR